MDGDMCILYRTSSGLDFPEILSSENDFLLSLLQTHEKKNDST